MTYIRVAFGDAGYKLPPELGGRTTSEGWGRIIIRDIDTKLLA
jgi:hypothetical protein